MEEVTVRLQFTRPALGYAERKNGRQVLYVMPRDPSQRVIFLASWWRDRMDYAARVLNRYQELAQRIAWDQTVEGALSRYSRDVRRKRAGVMVKCGYAVHEAFRPGAVLTVNAVLPDNLPIAAFRELLDIVGRYKGMSPYQSDADTYGTFDVLSIEPRLRAPIVEVNACNSSSAVAEP